MSKKLRIIVAAVVAIAIGLACLKPVSFFLLTGSFYPLLKIETLHSPVAVETWTEGGLVLSDGRTVAIPGLLALPNESIALKEATKRGVEIAPDGRIIGLMRVHRWCGNDPVVEHVARVDLTHLLVYFQQGTLAVSLPNYAMTEEYAWRDSQFSQFGWLVGQYLIFQGWSDRLITTNLAPNGPWMVTSAIAQP